MSNYYELSAIPLILKNFKVRNIVISGMSNEQIINKIMTYCNENNASFVAIDLKNKENHVINDYTLNVLDDFKDYDAIFLNDDPNWYTVFSELNVIKEFNDEFPLVFICNNTFPHKYRDSYINPDIIPEEYRHDYSKNLIYNDISIDDGFFHAIEENTSKNGVSVAIKDFLKDNESIGMVNFKLSNGITILYLKNSISQIRLSKISEELAEYVSEYDDLSDILIENNILKNHISNLKLSNDVTFMQEKIDEQNEIIDGYENEIEIKDTELSYKDTQITGVNSKLNLKDAQIKNLESKLVNSNNEVNNLQNKLDDANEEIRSLKNEITNNNQDFINEENELKSKIDDANDEIKSLKNNLVQKEKKESELNNQLQLANNQVKDKTEDIRFKNKQIEIKDSELQEKENDLSSIKKQYINQLSKLDNNEYCITCFKEELSNNHLEIQYLKNDNIIKRILSPFAYIYLVFKSNPRELSLNIKLYRFIKNSKCFDIGYYLNNNKDIGDSKWCKYFSPELHYVCNGFDEKRKFNKKYFNRNSKKELLNYILNCYN